MAFEKTSNPLIVYSFWTTSEEPHQAVCNYLCSLIFGIITCVTGVLGVTAGVEISRRWHRTNPRADPLVCAIGLLGSAPFLFLAVVFAQQSIVATYVSFSSFSLILV